MTMDNTKIIKIIFGVTGIIILACVGYSAYDKMYKENILVESQVTCDPEIEGPCYVWVCEPSWWDECTGDPEEDLWTYKLIDKKLYDMPDCTPVVETEGFFSHIVNVAESCPEQECAEGDPTCEVIYCDPETEGEYCYDESAWDEYVSTLYDGVSAACDDNIGDYLNDPDYCAILEEMDAAAMGTEEEAGLEEEGALLEDVDEEGIMVEEEQSEL